MKPTQLEYPTKTKEIKSTVQALPFGAWEYLEYPGTIVIVPTECAVTANSFQIEKDNGNIWDAVKSAGTAKKYTFRQFTGKIILDFTED